MRRLFRVTLVVLLALGAALMSWVPAQAAGASSIFTNPLVRTAGLGPIQHVIVIMQSGHSFDNYFGTRPNVAGVPPKTCLPIVVGSGVCVKSYHLNPDEARVGLRSTVGVTSKAIDKGKMDAFVSAQPNAAIGTLAMGYQDGSDLPYYWDLASRFTLFDHFFASSQAGALPNRLVAVTGEDDGLTTDVPPAGGINLPTVFDQLNAKKLSWKFYLENYPGAGTTPTRSDVTRDPLLSMTPSSASADKTVGTTQYFEDLAAGHLPAVSYVSGVGNSEKSPQSSAAGEAFVRSILNALMQSPEWYHTAVLLTYDDSGGWYDHLKPPLVAGKQLGIRVPAMLISPYARAGYVDHSQFQTASIPDFIDQVFGMPLLNTAAGSPGLVDALNPKQPALAPVIDRGSVATLVRPPVFGVYFLYLGALAATALLVALAFIRMRRVAASSSTGGAVAVPPGAPPAGGAGDGVSGVASAGDAGPSSERGERANRWRKPGPPASDPVGRRADDPDPEVEPGGPVDGPVDVSVASDLAAPAAPVGSPARSRRQIFRRARPAASNGLA